MPIISTAAHGDGDSCFQGWIMGIRALCAAAAVVAGVGSAADAATVDRVRMTLTGEYSCPFAGCEEYAPIPPVTSFKGLAVNEAITGWLMIGDQKQYEERAISFTVDGTVYHLGSRFIDLSGGNYQESNVGYQFSIAWNGVSGFLSYADDGSPHELTLTGTLELAPVPLPASAALLPLGVGALAMMRRRRRSV